MNQENHSYNEFNRVLKMQELHTDGWNVKHSMWYGWQLAMRYVNNEFPKEQPIMITVKKNRKFDKYIYRVVRNNKIKYNKKEYKVKVSSYGDGLYINVKE